MQATRGDAAIPSLFVDDATARTLPSRPGLLAELEGPQDARRRSPLDALGRLRRRPRLVAPVVVAFVVVACALVWLDGGGHADPDPMDAQRTASAIRTMAPGAATATSPAMILDEPPPPGVRARAIDADPASGPGGDPVQLLRGRDAPAVAPPRRRPAPPVDRDVDLLAALMHHSARIAAADAPGTSPGGRPGTATAVPAVQPAIVATTEDSLAAVSRTLAACPAANTDAGLACRESACRGRWGEHPSCPRPTLRDAAHDGQGPGLAEPDRE